MHIHSLVPRPCSWRRGEWPGDEANTFTDVFCPLGDHGNKATEIFKAQCSCFLLLTALACCSRKYHNKRFLDTSRLSGTWEELALGIAEVLLVEVAEAILLCSM